MDVTNLYAAVAVSDIDEARAWYTRLLGRKPDRQPMPVDIEWDLAGSGAGGLQVVQTDRPGGSMVTIAVDDIDTTVDEIRDRGIDIESSPHQGAYWLTQVCDPDGNLITFSQPAA
jgi:catechol 2,3-dioxygenase-like lactoylglutathione lyase family enzyme